MGVAELSALIITGVFTFLWWLVKNKFSQIQDQETRITKLETKFDLLGDIHSILSELKTDVAIIKHRIEKEE